MFEDDLEGRTVMFHCDIAVQHSQKYISQYMSEIANFSQHLSQAM